MAKPDVEKVELDKYRIVGERIRGQKYANEDGDFWKNAYVVGFDNHGNTGALVNADNEQDAVDAAADFYEDWAPGYFIDPKEIDEYDEDELVFVGNYGLPVQGHLIWIVEIPISDVPEPAGGAPLAGLAGKSSKPRSFCVTARSPREAAKKLRAMGGLEGSAGDLYDRLKAAGIEMDHHESDLYVLDTPEARKIIREVDPAARMAGQAQAFRADDGRMWIDIPFAYTPFWRKQRR